MGVCESGYFDKLLSNYFLLDGELMKKLIAITILIGIAILAFFLKDNVLPKKPIIKVNKKTLKPNAHTMLKKDRDQLMSDMKKGIDILQGITDDPKPLSKILDGTALKNMTKNVNDLLAKGRVKVRVFDNATFRLAGNTKDIAQVTFEFVDKSYEYDIKTKKVVTRPKNEKRKFALAVYKKDNVWKIFNILQPSAKSRINVKK